MARARQQYPQNYASADNISNEFEYLYRYINAAEIGNKTLGELLQTLFNDDGKFAGPIAFRLNSSSGLQYRVGSYASEEDGWIDIASLASLRGEPGQSFGTIATPPLSGLATYTAVASQSIFPYVHADGDVILVWKNGLLLRPGNSYDYVTNHVSDTITLNTPAAANDRIIAVRFAQHPDLTYTRVDHDVTATQSVFAFDFTEVVGQIFVYKNGILQKEGATEDYLTQPPNNSITMMTAAVANDRITIVGFRRKSSALVAGLMLEDVYVNPETGKILFDKIGINDGQIPQAKVSGLASALSSTPRLYTSATTPPSANAGDLWLDTSVSPNRLRYFDGTVWHNTTAAASIPQFSAGNAGQFLRVDGTGTTLQWGSVDLSSLIPRTEKGAANGVASLDNNGRLPASQLPEVRGKRTIYFSVTGAVTNGDYIVTRFLFERVRIVGLSAYLTSGTCSIQLKVNDIAVGNVYALSSSPQELVLPSAIQIEAAASSKTLEVAVSSAASANTLGLALSIEMLS